MGKELREDIRRGNFIEFPREDTVCYEFYAVSRKINIHELHKMLGPFHQAKNSLDTISKHP